MAVDLVARDPDKVLVWYYVGRGYVDEREGATFLSVGANTGVMNV